MAKPERSTWLEEENERLKERVKELEAEMSALYAELCVTCTDVWHVLFTEDEDE